MAVLVGIDEVGYGPILGPMVVSSCSFSLPGELLTADLWQILKKSISINRKHLSGRLLVTDSKKAYTKSLGIKHLERTALTALKCLDKEPVTLVQLLDTVCLRDSGFLNEYPWYKDAGNLPLTGDSADRAVAADVLMNDLTTNGVKLLDITSCCLDVAYYNKMVRAVKNKANVLFTATAQLIKKAYESSDDNYIHFIVDRQGGRTHYRNNLQKMFPEMELRILEENPNLSSYEMSIGDKVIRLHFTIGADGNFLPVSLASMVSKYLREILVDCINRYFREFRGDIRPTAGYWQDGRRFIQEIREKLPDVVFDDDKLLRCL